MQKVFGIGAIQMFQRVVDIMTYDPQPVLPVTIHDIPKESVPSPKTNTRSLKGSLFYNGVSAKIEVGTESADNTP
jgi:hypothetical protein